MAKRLSQYFGVKPEALRKFGVFNSYIGLDNKLFVDPKLFERTSIPEFEDARQEVQNYFAKVISLVSASKREGDLAWQTAKRLLTIHETRGVALGYAGAGEYGKASGPALAGSLIERLKEIIGLGITDPEILELIGLFQERFGSDFLSDMAISILHARFLAYTQRVTKALKLIPVSGFVISNKNWKLPVRADGKRIVFVPGALLNKLPIALDRSEIDEVAAFNAGVRQTWNRIVSAARDEDRAVTKSEIRAVLLERPKNLKDLLQVYKNAAGKGYDFDKDPDGLFSWELVGRSAAQQNPLTIDLINPKDVGDVLKVLDAIVKQFKKNIEDNKLYEVLYKDGGDGGARNEVFAQRLFYAVADAYCAANNVDLNREPNAGNGPVDFKLSSGYKGRVLVEVKKSNNQKLVHGYEVQLRAYERSESTERSMYLIIRVTETQNLIREVLKRRDEEIKKGKAVPQVVVIDARKALSASKRKADSASNAS